MRPWAVVACKRYALMYIIELLGQDPAVSALNAVGHAELLPTRRCRIPLRQLPVGSRAVEHRLLERFPAIEEVLATDSPAGLILVCRGHEDVDAWIECVEELFDSRLGGTRARWPRQSRLRTDDNGWTPL
jgi:hypothetical protein